jgi:hypothetical protein
MLNTDITLLNLGQAMEEFIIKLMSLVLTLKHAIIGIIISGLTEMILDMNFNGLNKL